MMRTMAMGLVLGVVLATSAFADQNNEKADCLYHVMKRVPSHYHVKIKESSVKILPNKSEFTSDYRVDLLVVSLNYTEIIFSWVCKFRYGNVESVFRVCRRNFAYSRQSSQNLPCLLPLIWR